MTALRLLLVLVCLAVPSAASAAPDVTLFRLFLHDGRTLVSYGEYVRVDDAVVFSMPVGGAPDEPRLQVVTLRAELVDWVRTEEYAASARYQRYAETRGEEDFQRLTDEVAEALNGIALNTDRAEALALARRVRDQVADWPRSHYGYRATEVRDIVSVLDEAISSLSGRSSGGIELSLVAIAGPPHLEPVLGMPGPVEQLDQILHLATLTPNASERVALLQAALVRVEEARDQLSDGQEAAFRRVAESRIGTEREIDRQYAALSARMMARATQAAEQARGSDIERLLAQVPDEDERLGRRRPDVIRALDTSLRGRLGDARLLRLRRDQWTLRLPIYERYERDVGPSVGALVTAVSALEAIRALDGPHPDDLVRLRAQLSGGAEHLERMGTPAYLRELHERLVGAWRFAENAAAARFRAVSDIDPVAAWEASSSAAGAMILIARVQEELAALLEPPTLQ